MISCISFPQFFLGYLPVRLDVIDIDERNSSNSRVTISIISQEPQEPKIHVVQLNDRVSQLGFKGCFNYDVRLNDIHLLVHSHTYASSMR